jgi:hypothetical protein
MTRRRPCAELRQRICGAKSLRLPTKPTHYFPRKGMMRKSLALFLLLSGTSFACAQPARDEQTVVIGPWEIATTFKGDKFDNCSMNRVVDGIAVSFVRTPDGGLLLLLDSPRWKLERGKSYPVRLSTGSQLLEANALAEAKAVTIALPDIRYSERLKAAAVLQVRGEGATIRVPLDKSALALDRLEACFEKNARGGPETNPFVAPSRKP